MTDLTDNWLTRALRGGVIIDSFPTEADAVRAASNFIAGLKGIADPPVQVGPKQFVYRAWIDETHCADMLSEQPWAQYIETTRLYQGTLAPEYWIPLHAIKCVQNLGEYKPGQQMPQADNVLPFGKKKP